MSFPYRLLAIDVQHPLYRLELELRGRVLRIPLGFPSEDAVTDFEDQCLHVIAVAGERVVACVLLHPQEARGRLLQMAVDPPFQGRGIGTELVAELEHKGRKMGLSEVFLHARHHAISFYRRLGYEVVGDVFVEVGIEHYQMVKTMARREDEHRQELST